MSLGVELNWSSVEKEICNHVHSLYAILVQ